MATTTLSAVQIIEVGDGGGIPLPPEVLARLGIKLGDMVVVEPAENGFVIRPLTEHERQMELAKQIMVERYDLLRRLAE